MSHETKQQLLRKSEAVKSVTFVLILTVFSILLSANSVHAIEVTATVPVGLGPVRAVYDSGRGEVFVANGGSNSVSVISDVNDSVIATISLPSDSPSPSDIAYDSSKGEIFVLNNPFDDIFASSTISVISDTTNSIVTTINLGFSNVAGICYDLKMRDIVVASQTPGGPVTFISDTSNSVASTVNVGGHPQGIVYDSGTGAIFVSTEGDTNSWVSVIPDYSNAVITNVTVQNVPIGLAYDSGKGEIFAAIVGTTELVNPELGVIIISDQTNSVVASVPMSEGTVNLAYDNKQGLIFVSYAGESNVVSVISDSSNSVVANITLADPTLWGLCYDSAKSEIYAPNFYNSTVTVISDELATTHLATTPSSTPTVPESSWLAILPVFIFILSIAIIIGLGLAVYFRKHKPKTESDRNLDQVRQENLTNNHLSDLTS